MSGLDHTIAGDPRLPAILFLHGFMGSGADWASEISVLDEHFYCVAPDLPGHGSSLALPPDAYTIEGTTRALLDLLDELGITRAVLVGYSMGGRIALYLALRHPERCSGLFLQSASPGIEEPAERLARRKADEERARRLESGDLASFLEAWYRQPLFASLARREGLLRETIEARMRNDRGERARSGVWGPGINPRCGRSSELYRFQRSRSPGTSTRGTLGSPLAWRPSAPASGPPSSPVPGTTSTSRARKRILLC